MMKLNIYIEIGGNEYKTGCIMGNSSYDAYFAYDKEYMEMPNSFPISVSMPFQDEPFDAVRTRNFFEGLLPEGFTRRTVSQWAHVDENDYLKLLAALGKECLGALKVLEEDDEAAQKSGYERISIDDIRAIAEEGATKSAEIITKTHLSLTGASGKVGMYYDEVHDEWYLPTGAAASTHIVKQSHVRLESIVVNEQISMLTARRLGIDVPDSFIVSIGNNSDSEILYATKRYDRSVNESCRMIDGLRCPHRLHQEDMAQALGISSANKYEQHDEHHMKSAFDLLRNVSINPIKDQSMLWKIIIYNFLLGNTDAHLKNFALIYGDNGRGVRLAPAYDLLSTTIYNQSTRNMAFRIGDVHSLNEINRNTFITAAADVNLGHRRAMSIFDEMADKFEAALKSSCEELKSQGFNNVDDIAGKIIQTGGYANIG